MGADGGTIPKRCELVRKKKKQEKLDPKFANAAKYRTCQLSNEPLKKPIVACKLGRLYNKEAIIEAKLSKALANNEITKHIKALSDVKELRLTDNKAYQDDGPDKGDAYKDHNETPFICPITALPINGVHTFLVNWACGCVFSEKALQEFKSETCYGCGGVLNKEELIQLYPGEELLNVYEKRITEERAQKLKAKKEKQEQFDQASQSIAGPSTSSDAHLFVKPALPAPKEAKKEVKAEPKEPKEPKDFGWTKLTGEKSEIPEKAREALKRKFEYKSIQDDPNVPKSVKSLFTSSDEAKKQPKAHWVTHNPLYF